jgi:hypothetical protein
VEGRNYKMMAHSLQTTTNRHQKTHFLSQWNIKIDSKALNCYNCTLTTSSSDNEGKSSERIYKGIATFDKSGEDQFANNLLFIFGKDGKGRATDPITMMGRIRKDSKDKPDDILLLHITYFSQHHQNTVSKIGVLHIRKPSDEKLTPIAIDKALLSSKDPIVLYLLRMHKVVMQSLHTRNNSIINSTAKIESWIADRFKDLRMKDGKDRTGNYNLYYKTVEDKSAYQTAEVNIYSNGLVTLTRNNNSMQEIYYGEINFRHKGSQRDGVVFMKFLRTVKKDNDSEEQDYREIFILLTWPSQPTPLEKTRGIIVGDRDEGIFDKNRKVIEADRCLMCKDTLKLTNDEICDLLDPTKDGGKLFDKDSLPTIESDTHGTLVVQYDSKKC